MMGLDSLVTHAVSWDHGRWPGHCDEWEPKMTMKTTLRKERLQQVI